MNRSVYVVLGTLLGFTLGFFFAKGGAKPQLPSRAAAPLLTEFAGRPGPQPIRLSISPDEVRRLEEENNAIRRDLALFQAEHAKLNSEYQQRIASVLSSGQKEKWLKMLQNPPSVPAPEAGEPANVLLSADPSEPIDAAKDVLIAAPGPSRSAASPSVLAALPAEAVESIVELVFVTWSTSNLREELGLTPSQETQVKALLTERRERFLELSDRLPPPSLRTLQLAKRLRQRVQ